MAGPKIALEGISRDGVLTIGDTMPLGVFFRNGQYLIPISAEDLRVRILFSDHDAVNAVAGSDIQDL